MLLLEEGLVHYAHQRHRFDPHLRVMEGVHYMLMAERWQR